MESDGASGQGAGSGAGALGWVRDEPGRALVGRVRALLGDARAGEGAHREAMKLACEVYRWQCAQCVAVGRVARAFGADETGRDEPGGEALARDPFSYVDSLPGVPTDVFKSARVACFDPRDELRVFRTSGTTRDVRGTHALPWLACYDDAACAAGRRWLLPRERYCFVLLAPPPDEVSDSSLGYMLELFAERWGAGRAVWAVSQGAVVLERVERALDEAVREGVPVALLGATFAFVHALDGLASGRRWALPEGSVAMPTGGFKGRARELAAGELFAVLRERFGLERESVVQEYGMTELSSQCYEAHAEGGPAGRYYAPPWVRVRAVDPETLEVLPPGEQGLLKIVDLANVGSCVAVQTSDLGVLCEDGGFEVHGRAPGATPRGCARAIDAVLSGEG